MLDFPEGGYLTADAPDGQEVLRIGLAARPDGTPARRDSHRARQQRCPERRDVPRTPLAKRQPSHDRSAWFVTRAPERAALLAGTWTATVIEYLLDRRQPYT